MPEILTTKRVFLTIIFLGIVAMSARDVSDPDVWWHLKTGQLIAQTEAVPRVDSFSFTRAGYPWVAHEWLSELFIYGIYRSTSWGGLIVVFAVMVSATFYLVYLRSARSPYCSGLIVLLGAWATAPFWGVRPQMVSLLLTALWLLILERSERIYRLLWWTLPLTVLWVNLHAGFALGLALLLLFLAGELVEQFSSPHVKHARLRVLAITFAADLILVPLSPNGWKMFLYPIDTLRSEAIQKYIAEWASPNFHHAEYFPFLLLLIATSATLGWSRLRVRPRDLLLLMVSTFAALSSARMIPFFVVIAVPILSRAVAVWVRSELSAPNHSASDPSGSGRSTSNQAGAYRPGANRPHLGWHSRVPAPYAGLINALILLFIAGFAGFQIHRIVHRQPQVEVQRFPSGAVAYLQAHPANGPLFNLYDWGGYLIWKLNPETPVFIDGRADLYGESLMRQFADVYDLRDDWQERLQTWRIGTVLVRPDCALAVALRRVVGWEVRYSDPQAVVFERSARPPR